VPENGSGAGLQSWHHRILFTIWITYFGFYFCRKNIAAALPAIASDLGVTNAQLAILGTCLAASYAIGQFINGQLGDRYGARLLVTVGIIGSVLLNIAFGFSRSLRAMAVIWGANGFFQSMGWGPITKTVANWFPQGRRGSVSGVLGTSYHLGEVATLLLTGVLLAGSHWRMMFWAPAGLLALLGIHFAIRVRNAPEEVGLPTAEEQEDGVTQERDASADEHLGLAYTLRQTVGNPRVWIVGVAFFWLHLVQWGFLYWSVKMFTDMHGDALSTAALKAAAIPVAGALGAISAGWATDRLFGGRRAPLACVMIVGLAAAICLFGLMPELAGPLLVLLLGLIGFLNSGAQLIMCAPMAMDMATRKAASAAAGFIDALGYAGVGTGIAVTGVLVDRFATATDAAPGWQAALLFWSGAAVISALLMATLWRYKPARGEYH